MTGRSIADCCSCIGGRECLPRAGLGQIEGLDTGDPIGVPSRTPSWEAIEGPGREVIGAPARVDVAIGVPRRIDPCELIGVL